MSVSVTQQAKGAIRVASPWMEWLARLGYAAKGLVYVIIGALAVQLAAGEGGQAGGATDAFQFIRAQPFGRILLGVMAAGLAGYAVWLVLRAGLKTKSQSSDIKDIVARVKRAITGLAHLGLAFVAAQLALGTSSGSSGSSVSTWTARLMAQPFGRWLVGIVGVIVIGAGLYRLYRAYMVKLNERLKLNEMSASERKWTIRFGRAGLAAQGFVLALIGGFLVQAAVQYQPSEARGLGGALQTLAHQPYGTWLLAVVAIGLMAHGLYNFVLARYRRIETI